jgi:hypothetical protein
VSTDKHQGPKKGPSARREQRKASSGGRKKCPTRTTDVFFDQSKLDLGQLKPAGDGGRIEADEVTRPCLRAGGSQFRPAAAKIRRWRRRPLNVTGGDSRLDLGTGGRDSIAGTAEGLDHGDRRAAGRDSIAGRESRGQLRPGVAIPSSSPIRSKSEDDGTQGERSRAGDSQDGRQ